MNDLEIFTLLEKEMYSEDEDKKKWGSKKIEDLIKLMGGQDLKGNRVNIKNVNVEQNVEHVKNKLILTFPTEKQACAFSTKYKNLLSFLNEPQQIQHIPRQDKKIFIQIGSIHNTKEDFSSTIKKGVKNALGTKATKLMDKLAKEQSILEDWRGFLNIFCCCSGWLLRNKIRGKIAKIAMLNQICKYLGSKYYDNNSAPDIPSKYTYNTSKTGLFSRTAKIVKKVEEHFPEMKLFS